MRSAAPSGVKLPRLHLGLRLGLRLGARLGPRSCLRLALGVALVALLGGPAQAGPGNALGTPPPAPPGGYRIWFDGTWHLRGVAGDKARKFHGTLGVPGGSGAIQKLPKELPAKLATRGGAIVFEFSTAAEAGFDFSSEAKCLVLELMVDDRHLPELLRIGKGGVAPRLFPYEACK